MRSIHEYHERSKHRLDRYAPGPGQLDWANQPDPFRTYAGTPRIELPLLADKLSTRFNDVRRGTWPAPAHLDRDTVAILLELSLGLSAWKSFGGTSWALRCNPSSGNLHPTEGYVLSAGMPGLAAGVYHYLSRDHALEQRARFAGRAQGAGGFFVGLSTIYWREAWKYGMRAFRYCQHDCGHAIAAVAYAAAALGWRARVLTEPGDDDIARLLGLDRDGDYAQAEREAPECLMWIGEGEPPAFETFAQEPEWSGCANALSTEHRQWLDIDRVHAAARKPVTKCNDAMSVAQYPALAAPRLDLDAAAIFRQRRSAVEFDGVTRIDAASFCNMLDATLPRAGAPPWLAWSASSTVHLALFVHRVDGIEPGLYAFVRDPCALSPLRAAMRADWLWKQAGPEHLPLYMLIPYDLRQHARLVSCHQDIAADGCFALGMLADFRGLEAEPWRYRERYWECGLIGQTLYLEAEADGVRATGIGCFFDDEMHALLGIEGDAWQSLYHFTVGGAVEDTRLTTSPPYSFPPRR